MLYAKMYESQERKDELRLIAGYIVKFGGMGSSDGVTLQQIMHLPLLDNELKELPIRTEEEARQILRILVDG